MRLRLAILIASASLCVASLSACGGSSDNGIASKSADQIVSAASKAVAHVKSLHISGTVLTSGVPLSLDLSLVNGQGGRGSISEGGLSFRLIELAQTVYIQGSQAFWEHSGGPAAARLIGNRWLKAPATGQFASVAALTNLQQLLGAALLSKRGQLTKGGTSTINGQPVVAITTSNGGTLYVATTGPPYPVEVKRKGSEGQISFGQFDQPVALAAPANSISVSQLG